MNDFEISLFPIHGSVSFPFSEVPLHVFEPRYRKMICDSITSKRRIGVAHTKRLISKPKEKLIGKEANPLNQNQETYEAHAVFSAGFAEIIETLPDGRMLVSIKMDNRYERVDELQHLPYSIVQARVYEDQLLHHASLDLLTQGLRRELDQIFLSLRGPHLKSLHQQVRSQSWKALPLLEYSFSIYSMIKLEPDILQRVLELKSSLERISFLKDYLTPTILH